MSTDDDVETETGGAQATEVAVASWPVCALGGLRVLVPGVSCAAAVAVMAGAEGRSNAAIARRLFITDKAVSKHAAGIFGQLDLAPSDDDNRRVLAVLAYLDS